MYFHLDSDKIISEIKALYEKEPYHTDYLMVKSFGISAFPALVLEKDGKFMNIRGIAMTLEALENNFEYAVNYLDNV